MLTFFFSPAKFSTNKLGDTYLYDVILILLLNLDLVYKSLLLLLFLILKKKKTVIQLFLNYFVEY